MKTKLIEMIKIMKHVAPDAILDFSDIITFDNIDETQYQLSLYRDMLLVLILLLQDETYTNKYLKE